MSNCDGFKTKANSIVRISNGALAVCRKNWPCVTIVTISCVLTTLYLVARPYILYHDSDPLTYFRKAWLLLGRPGGIDVASRGPGYPLWLIVTGAASFDSWWPLMASQIVMAAVVPALAYGILAPISRIAGFIAGLLFMLFGLPYFYMNWAMTEQLFLFVELSALLMISRYLCGAWSERRAFQATPRSMLNGYKLSQWLSTPYPIAVLLAYDTTIKPATGPFFWLFLLICLLFRIDSWKRYAGPTVLYIAIIIGWGMLNYYDGSARFPTLATPTSDAQRYFADAYYGDGYGAVGGNQPNIRSDDGPASHELYRAVTDTVRAARKTGQWNSTNPTTVKRLYSRFDSAEKVTDEIFARPNPLYFGMVVSAAASAGGDALLYQVAREHHRAGSVGLVRYFLKHPGTLFFGPPNPYLGYMLLSKFFRYPEFRSEGYVGVRDLFVPDGMLNLIGATNGPASQKYVNSILYFIDTFPEFVNLRAYLRDFPDVESFERYVIENPRVTKYSGTMMGTIYTWFSMLYGEERAGQLMGATAFETVFHHPVTWGFFVGDFFAVTAYGEGGEAKADLMGFLKDFRGEYSRVKRVQEELLKERVEDSRTTQLPIGLAKYMNHYDPIRTELQKNINTILLIQYSAFAWVKPLWFAAMLVFPLALIVAGIGARIIIFLTGGYFGSAIAMTIFMIPPEGDPRQETFFAFLPLLVLSVGIAALPKFFTLIRQKDGLN